MSCSTPADSGGAAQREYPAPRPCMARAAVSCGGRGKLGDTGISQRTSVSRSRLGLGRIHRPAGRAGRRPASGNAPRSGPMRMAPSLLRGGNDALPAARCAAPPRIRGTGIPVLVRGPLPYTRWVPAARDSGYGMTCVLGLRFWFQHFSLSGRGRAVTDIIHVLQHLRITTYDTGHHGLITSALPALRKFSGVVI